MSDSNRSLFTTNIKILNWNCNQVSIYLVVLVFFFVLIVGRHKLNTTIHQQHREALALLPKKRHLTSIICLSVVHTLLHVVFVLFISSNNMGFIIVSIFAHAVGVYFVFRYQIKDQKHPIHSLATALRTYDRNDQQTMEDIHLIRQQLYTNDQIISNEKPLNL